MFDKKLNQLSSNSFIIALKIMAPPIFNKMKLLDLQHVPRRPLSIITLEMQKKSYNSIKKYKQINVYQHFLF